jgi:hypothetical protein
MLYNLENYTQSSWHSCYLNNIGYIKESRGVIIFFKSYNIDKKIYRGAIPIVVLGCLYRERERVADLKVETDIIASTIY